MNKEKLKTPAFIFDLDKIDHNLNKLTNALKLLPKSQMLYSLKTNNIPKIIKHLSKKGVFIEVVSREEYDYVESLNIDLSKVVFNGPCKTKDDLKLAIKNNSYLNLDNLEEINNIIELKEYLKRKKYHRLGIRLNIDLPKEKMQDLIGYSSSRFGITEEEFEKALTILNQNQISLNGIHVHINHNYEIIENYEFLSKKIMNLLNKYDLKIEYIDFGGGILRAVESVDYKEAINIIKKTIPNDTLIMIEPGAALTANAGELITKVIAKKDVYSISYLTIDASKNYYDITNKFPNWNHYRIERLTNRDNKEKQIICGFTCMENDRLFTIINEKEIAIGDYIIIEKVGSYSLNFIPFFIKGLPNIYIKEKNKTHLTYKNKTITELYHETN